MKAVYHRGEAGFAGVHVDDMPDKEPKEGEVKIRLKTAGLNHRDLTVPTKHGKADDLVVIGSDGAGVIEALGAGVGDWQPGDEVVINPSLRWEENSPAPPPEFEILGLPDDGTFAESIIVSAANIERKPANLSWTEAGVLPLGALTGYRALFTRGKLQADQTVLIPGVGGGVATYMVQMAAAAGARVIVTSRSEAKRKQALELGAARAIDSEEDWHKELEGETVDLVIDSVGGATFHQSLGAVKQGGTMVIFGSSTNDEVNLNLRKFFYGQYNLLGSTMGSAQEFREMLAFVAEKGIKPVVDRSYPLAEALAAFKRLEAGEQFGKISLVIDD